MISIHLRQAKPRRLFIGDAPSLQRCKVLDIAMGEGANAVYLAQKGYEVDAFDISEIACSHASRLARDTGVEINIQCTDMDHVSAGYHEYDTVIMTYFKPAVLRYYPEIIKCLKQGGTFLLESAHVEATTEALAPSDSYRNYFFSTNEVLPASAWLILALLLRRQGRWQTRGSLFC